MERLKVLARSISRRAYSPQSYRRSHTLDEGRINGSPSNLAEMSTLAEAPTKSKASGASTRSYGNKIFSWICFFVVACCRFMYYRGLLMSVPSFPSFTYAIEDFNATAKARLSTQSSAKLDGDWKKFVDHMSEDWANVTRQCKWAAFTCITVERFMGPVAGSSFAVVTAFSFIVYFCSGFAIVLCAVMKRHAVFLRRSPEASWNWHLVTERNAESAFIATSSLLASPVAWKNWTYISFGTFAISLLWCFSSSGSSVTYMADTMSDLQSKDPTAEVDAGPLTVDTRGVPISTLARALFIAVGVIGLLHTAFVWVHFYQLGYPSPRTPKRHTRNVGCRLHSRYSERSMYEEPEDYISSISSLV